MPVFIDRLPFDQWTDQTRSPPLSYWSVLFSVFLTEPGLPSPPPGLAPQSWLFDTGNLGEAFAWRHHLVQGGLDPDVGRLPGSLRVAGAISTQPGLAVLRSAELWLVSNLPAFAGNPHRLLLDRGLAFLDVPQHPDPRFNRPLIGMRAFRRAGLRVEIDFANDTVSVWAPDPP